MSLLARCGTLLRNIFEGEAAGTRAEDGDGQDHDGHGCCDECEDSACAVVAQEESDEETGEDGAEAAPRIDEANSLCPDAGGE